MKHILFFLTTMQMLGQQAAPIRPPAVPLIAHDPYFSVWSTADRLNAEQTKHWTGTEQQLGGMIRVDGKAFRFLGALRNEAPAMKQVSLAVTPTRTVYEFEDAGVRLKLTFLTPALPHDLEVLARPATYIEFHVGATDGNSHAVQIYFDCGAQLAQNTPEQRVNWSRLKVGNLHVLRVGTAEQPVLARSGDNLRIDWGYLYLAVPPQENAGVAPANQRARALFVNTGGLPEDDDLEPPAQTARNQVVLASLFDLSVLGSGGVSRYVVLAYDDLFSVQYFHRNLRPYWRRKGDGARELLLRAVADYPRLKEECAKFDAELTADLSRAGGAKYAAIAVLAYRQALAAHKLSADLDGSPIYLSKENFSNGCIGTVDVFYPAAPMFLLLNPTLIEAQVIPIFDYAQLPRWPWPYAPHDLGQYPLANGQVYGGGERSEDRQMPVEESGNMLILTAAIARARGHADLAAKYWPLLSKWAEYLRAKGMDPENQLSTDDFAGHLAHNTNLSIKAIVALGAYAQLAGKLGKQDIAVEYGRTAKEMAGKWGPMALDGDHYRLAFDKPDTWSQKYNLVWDKLLELNLFSGEIARKEMAFYRKMQNQYGLPLDNRENYTKLDWIVWTATLAENPQDFEALTDPVYKFLNESPSRVPMTDWYWTKDGRQRGFQARSVVGGVYIKMLEDRAIWSKWVGLAK
jgi:hypothetical protein